MKDPIIVTGAPRSRTSLTMQIIEICGCFLGDVLQATKANPQGMKENRRIIDEVQKNHLKKYGYDPMGQNPLPPLRFNEADPNRKSKVLNIMTSQGLKDQIWGFKDAKIVLDWRAWETAFPDAKWVLVRRDDSGIINSCLRTSFMRKYKNKEGWQKWINEYKLRMDDLEKNGKNVQVVNTDDLIAHKFDTMQKIIENLGLIWKDKRVRNQIKP